MEIIPRIGVTNLRFGMTVDQVREVAGLPDADYIDADDGDRYLCYNRLGVALRFNEEGERRLGWIVVANPEATVFGRKAIGTRFSEIEALLDTELHDTKACDDSGYHRYTIWEETWIEVQHTLGWVQQINLGVTFNSDDEPLWPGE